MNENISTPIVNPDTVPFVINIGRQLGSGGRAIGKRLSQELGIAYFDKEILTIAARESGFCTEVFERSDEQKGFFRSVLGNLVPMMSSGGDFYNNQLSDEHLFPLQAEAIRKAAQQQSCIFIGRCADYILRDHPRHINLFFTANLEDRVARMASEKGITAEQAEELIEKTDRRRADYYNYYSGKTWGAAESYDLCINTSHLGFEGTAKMLIEYIESRVGTLPLTPASMEGSK